MQAAVCRPDVRAENKLSQASETRLKAERAEGGVSGKTWRERERRRRVGNLPRFLSSGSWYKLIGRGE